MSQALADSLNLQLAWQRLLFDRPGRCFVSHPYLIPVVEQNLRDWLESIRNHIVVGYAPSPCVALQVPKGNWQVRPGAYLQLDDEVVLNALLGLLLENVIRELHWSQGEPDIAYQLSPRPDRYVWVKRGVKVWQQWREKSKERIRQGAEFVLFADISAFYENVDLKRLVSDLRRFGVSEEAEHLLATCLSRWSEPRGKGIPQGYSAADILAKIYLDPVDRNLRHEGFDHLRYVDDIRVFCTDSREAKRALLKLSEMLRIRGLDVQSAKTEICRADSALHKIDGIAPVIHSINEELLVEVRDVLGDAAYATPTELEQLVAIDPDNPPPPVLERAFVSHFLDPATDEFDKSLFHFLLTRLGSIHSRIAIDYCLGLLSKRPEETEYVLRYLGKVGLGDEEHERILGFLNSPECIYEYQIFQILRHYFELGSIPASLLNYCRRLSRDGRQSPWVVAYATGIVGSGGDAADHEFLEASYPRCANALERVTTIGACQRMEIGRRNAFLGRARTDGPLEELAVLWVRSAQQ